MEGDKNPEPASSSPSVSSDLFGPKDKDSSSSCSRIFDSVFSTPSMVVGRDSSGSEVIGSWRMQDSEHRALNAKTGSSGNSSQSSEAQSHIISNKDRSSIFQETEPCSLSSSLYYGGQDLYSTTPNTRASSSPHIFNKDGSEDDSNENNLNCASRGNWWQGSLYY